MQAHPVIRYDVAIQASGRPMNEVLTLLLELYRGASERPFEEFQEFAIRLVQPALRFESARWGAGSLEPDGFKPGLVHLHNEPDESVASWEDVLAQDTIVPEVLARPGATVSAHVPSRYAGKDQAGIRDYARKYRHQNILATAFVAPGRGSAEWLSFYRGGADDCFSEPERRACEQLTPHLLQALAINRNLHLGRLRQGQDGACFAMADPRGRLWHAEPAFLDLLAGEWPGWRAPLLPRRLAESLALRPNEAYAGKRCRIGAALLGKLLLLKARPRTPVDDLTPRELEIARAYGSGLSHREVAAQFNISPETVRHHLRAVFGKLGIGDKAELARFLPPCP